MLLSRFWRFSSITGSRIHSTVRSVSNDVKYMPRGEKGAVAYRALEGTNDPGVIFCHGFQSNMEGIKALALEEYCAAKGHPYIRFDHLGCGKSEGDISKVIFSDWKQDLIDVIDQLTAGPQLIVGSSMGAWLMFLAGMERPHRIHSMVGIASAPDFAQRAFQNNPEMKATLEQEGKTTVDSEYGSYILTNHFIKDAEKHSLLDKESIPIRCPVRFLHGMSDKYVSYANSTQLAEKLQSRDVLVVLRKAGDHRFSQRDDLQVLFEELDYLILGSRDARELADISWRSFSTYSRPEEKIKKKATYRAGDQPQNWPRKMKDQIEMKQN